MDVITFRNAQFAYERSGWRLDLPDLVLGRERMTCVVGPNGSGKSTMLRMASGILKCDSGAVFLNGERIEAMSRRQVARSIGFLPQESPPLFDYTVGMVVRMGRYVHLGWVGALTENDRRAIDAALCAVGMEAMKDRRLSRLSGGERRRALIAAVLAQEPRILLLDEPTAALDIHHAASVMRLLAQVAASGRAVVLVTHDLNLASLFAERLVIMANGQIIADGAPNRVMTEEVIRSVYGREVMVKTHPETGGPLVIVRGPGIVGDNKDD